MNKFFTTRSGQVTPVTWEEATIDDHYAAVELQQQPPSGGCRNCGGPVRTMKDEGWVCAKCVRLLA